MSNQIDKAAGNKRRIRMEEPFDQRPFDINGMILEVETYLGLPANTIDPFFSAEDHWVFVLKTTSIVETVLKTALFNRVRPNGGTFGGLGGLGGMLLASPPAEEQALRNHIFRIPLKGDIGSMSLARAYNVISKLDEDFIDELLSIRNRYAHSILNHSRPVLDIISERRDQNQVAACLRKLAYQKSFPVPPSEAGIREIEFGVLMFLAAMSGRLTPSETPPGGWLGQILAESRDQNQDGPSTE
jgi:hypothetical protein